MEKRKVWFFFLVLSLGLITFSACEEKNEEVKKELTDSEINMTNEDLLSESLYEEAFSTADEQLFKLDNQNYNTSSKKSVNEDNPCMEITVDKPDTSHFPKTLTIDYGQGCTKVFNGDTITKSGKLIVTINGRYFKEGASHSITFKDFYINGMRLEGTQTVINNGLNNSGNLSWAIELKNGKIIFPDSSEITRESSRTREWINNGTFFIRADDYFLITGYVNGSNGENTYQRTVLDSLKKETGWPFFVSGQVELQYNDYPAIILDYGDGSLDRKATLSRGDYSKEIMLGFKRKRFNSY